MPAAFVAGDWGTTHLRLFLCDAAGHVLNSASGPGAAQARGQHAAVLDALIEPWQRDHGSLPVILCGMVGSSFGWAQAPYVPCPVRPAQIAAACIELLAARVHIVPGLSCRNPFNAPDLMRGEETQILGALSLEPRLQRGRHMLCLPGTHTKWVTLEDGAVSTFLTSPTGELYALLCEHSVLVSDQEAPARDESIEAFERGLLEFNRFPQAQLLHRLFEIRSRRLGGELPVAGVAAYLSGLLIGSDVHGALQTLSPVASEEPVHLIGASPLTAFYAAALARQERRLQRLEGTEASLAGLIHVQRQLTQRISACAH